MELKLSVETLQKNRLRCTQYDGLFTLNLKLSLIYWRDSWKVCRNERRFPLLTSSHDRLLTASSRGRISRKNKRHHWSSVRIANPRGIGRNACVTTGIGGLWKYYASNLTTYLTNKTTNTAAEIWSDTGRCAQTSNRNELEHEKQLMRFI